MPDEKQQAVQCPNCQRPAIKTGNKISCVNCDAIFVITKERGARVKDIGPIEDLRSRVEALEGRHKKEDETEPESDDQSEPEQDNDILPE